MRVEMPHAVLLFYSGALGDRDQENAIKGEREAAFSVRARREWTI
jgi:hypothetical protein